MRPFVKKYSFTELEREVMIAHMTREQDRALEALLEAQMEVGRLQAAYNETVRVIAALKDKTSKPRWVDKPPMHKRSIIRDKVGAR